MRDIDLIEFINTGKLGFIETGSDKTELIEIFGKPKHINRWGKGQGLESIAWEFDNLIFGFDINTEKVCVIRICTKNLKKQEPSIGNKATIDNHDVKFGMESYEFENIANSNDLFYSEKLQWDNYGWVFEYPSGVMVSFQSDLNKNALLFEFSLTKPLTIASSGLP